MNEHEYVDVERAGPKTVITLDNVEKRNRLSEGMIADLTAALEAAERDESAAVVLTGKDGVFCAGADITSFERDAKEALGGRIFGGSDFRVLFETVEELEKPVIAAIDGMALAGGFELALVSDFVVVGEDVEMGTPESKIGIAPGVAYVRLTEQVSHYRAMEIMMTGASFTGAEVVEMGLFNAAVPVEAVHDVVDEYVRQLDRVAPVALTVIKKIANRHRGGEDRVVANLGVSVLFETDDAKEGFEAFREKREPNFEGS
ncbi:enoyl-CoA hydratase/isomerase family protein [Natronomonas marina]|jgi:enoyl-CoA hydratase/carnithine racemase|uniref:enoyl-CoA hydratase/isomerase family protein n=1 Tax=Natronomonas marina TaxID=2961939 RepID=UPI0020CA0535|nr:enoyl-CoA hydratase/isomerase family protein [Natronomonas marina]